MTYDENSFLKENNEILSILLMDRTSNKNIKWCSDNYEIKGLYFDDYITSDNIMGKNSFIIKPRSQKTRKEQQKRSKDAAEVFTPSWICNRQNNLIDEEWFQYPNAFNIETNNEWSSTPEVLFKNDKTWESYIKDTRLEITCGEAPYLVCRYDTVTGQAIDIKERIGLLDRKLRVVSENATSDEEWYRSVILSYQNIYGYDYQGDNVFLARQNLFFTFIDYYKERFNELPSKEKMKEIATIISWNIWQMDGLRMVIPNSCKLKKQTQANLFGEESITGSGCLGCQKDDIRLHNGTYCLVMDWEKNKKTRFVDLIRR